MTVTQHGDLKIQHEEVALSDVLDYFVRGYSKDGGEIEHYECFVDAAQGKVIVKLYIREAVNDGGHSANVSEP